MKTITVQAEVTADRMLKFEAPCDLPPGQVEVVRTIVSGPALPNSENIDWRRLSGLGRDVWQGVDAASYLRELRADREHSK